MIENIGLGLQLTIIGMGLVFLLLALLWGLMTLLLRLDGKQKSRGTRERRSAGVGAQEQESLGAEVNAGSLAPRLPGTSAPLYPGSPAQLSPEMLGAVMVAVRMHRRIRRKQAAPAMRSHQPGTLPSRWIGAGRVSQNQSWHPKRR